MAILVHVATGRRFSLGTRNLLGRASTSIDISAAAVSAEHGVIFFQEGRWWFRDLGSTNGSWHHDEAVSPGSRVELSRDSRLFLAERNETHGWRMASLEPPNARARAIQSGKVVEATSGLLQLVREDTTLEVFFDEATKGWQAETDAARYPVSDQTVVQLGDESYLLELPPRSAAAERTREVHLEPGPRVSDALLALEVSAHEEHVSLEVRIGGSSVQVPSRAHHYLLLTLARRRLDDIGDGGTKAEQGWVHVEELAAALKVSRQKLNLDVSRARRQLAELGFEDAVDLVERRPQAGQLRIGGASWVVRSA